MNSDKVTSVCQHRAALQMLTSRQQHVTTHAVDPGRVRMKLGIYKCIMGWSQEVVWNASLLSSTASNVDQLQRRTAAMNAL